MLLQRRGPIPLQIGTYIQEFLIRQEQANLESIRRTDVFTRFGWSRDLRHYVLGRYLVGGGGGRAIVDADERFLDAMHPRGNLGAYLDLCRSVIASSAAAEAAWAAGYAPPLLRLLGLRSLLLSFWGPSHGGKSASQALAISAWGRPEGLKLTGDATATAIEANLARCRDMLAWIDDTQQTRSQTLLDGLAYLVGGGTGKARGTVTGGLRRIASWLSIGFVSGEHPLLKLGVANGARNRTLELHVTPMTQVLAAQVHVALDQHYGLTGPAYLEELIARYVVPGRLDELRQLFDSFVAVLASGPADQTGRYIALLALADFLARMFVFGEDEVPARAAAVSMGQGLVAIARDQRDTTVDPIDAGYETIVAWVVENDACFRPEPPRSSDIPSRPPTRRYGLYIANADTGGRRVAAILPEPLREAMEKAGFNIQEILFGLLERGLLIPGEPDPRGPPRLGRKITIGTDRTRAYWVVLPGADRPDGGGAPRSLAAEGHAVGQANAQDGQGVPDVGPTVPAVPQVHGDEEPPLDLEEEGHAREFTPGTAGTVGHSSISLEEREERTATYVGPPPVPLCVPPGVPVGRPGAPDAGYELITTAEAAERACTRLAANAILFLDIRSYLVATDPVISPHGQGRSRSRPRRPREANRHELHDPSRTTIRLVLVAGRDGPVVIFDLVSLCGVPEALRRLLTNDQFDVVGYDLLPTARVLHRAHGIEIQNPISLRGGALLVGGYLDHKCEDNPYSLSRLAEHFLGTSVTNSDLPGTWSDPQLPPAQLDEAARSVAILVPLFRLLSLETDRVGVGMAWGIDNQVLPVVVDMEATGFRVDGNALQSYTTQTLATASAAEARAHLGLGDPSVNLNSIDEINARLRVTFGFELESNSFDCLETNAARCPALLDIVEYRRASTRAKAAERFLAAVDADGRIRGQFDPLRAAAGRFGCDHPAMLNIPGEPEFRRCFMAGPGNLLVDADLKAAQLRIIADHTQDPELLRAFCSNPPLDPHANTASILLGIPVTQITPDQRQLAKGINFGVSYGERGPSLRNFVREQYGVALSLEEAETFRRNFLARHSGIRTWQESLERQERNEMAPRSPSGRYRQLVGREARASKFAPSFAQAVEADGLKLAMSILHRRLRAIGWRIVHIMHDEVIGEGPAESAAEAQSAIESAMKWALGIFVRTVPIEVDAGPMTRWGEE